MFTGARELPAAFDARAWHVHEMLFGYLGAVLTGFLFTAIPNWTGRLPLRGAGLGVIFVLWIAGRGAVVVLPGTWISGVIDSAFLVVVASLAWREIMSGRNWRNAPICILVSLFAIANILFHIAATNGVAERFGLAVTAVLIGLVGGRVTPSFTRNWLAKRNATTLPVPFGVFDKFALLVLLAAFLAWVSEPISVLSGCLLIAASLLHLLRLARWRGWLVVEEPLLLVLHLGYGWLVLALFLMGCAALGFAGIEPTAALHALAVGAVGTMTLGVMTRATLGHTGHALVADDATRAMIAAITLCAVLRVAAPNLPISYGAAIAIAGLAWCLAFGLFVVRYGPILMESKPKNVL